jgi:hypothetical protein
MSPTNYDIPRDNLSPELVALIMAAQQQDDGSGYGVLRHFTTPDGRVLNALANYGLTGNGDAQMTDRSSALVSGCGCGGDRPG